MTQKTHWLSLAAVVGLSAAILTGASPAWADDSPASSGPASPTTIVSPPTSSPTAASPTVSGPVPSTVSGPTSANPTSAPAASGPASPATSAAPASPTSSPPTTAPSGGTASPTASPSGSPTPDPLDPAVEPSLTYRAHIEDVGWAEAERFGPYAGTVGQSRRLEAFSVDLDPGSYEGSIRYQIHVENLGWLKGDDSWYENGQVAGTTGRSLRSEAVKIELTGDLSSTHQVYYRVHSATLGWLDWAHDGQIAGTTGFGLRAEAVEIRLLPAGAAAPGPTTRPQVVYRSAQVGYQVHGQDYGWSQTPVTDGAMAGTTGQSSRIEALRVTVAAPGLSGAVRYRGHVESIGWQPYVQAGAIAGTTGQSLRLEAVQIELTGQLAEQFDVYYRAHVEQAGWLGWTKNGGVAGSYGASKRLEALEVMLAPKSLPGPAESRAYRTIEDFPSVTSYHSGIYHPGNWVEVVLSQQLVILHNGSSDLAAFSVSTGLPSTPTRPGVFRVYSKNPSQTMNGPGYSLPNVRWNSFFDGGIALHGVYWHTNFGHPMSHGCVGMREADAKTVYDFAPIGTLVHVHD
ncbi:MAG: L,D-transpeptidase family protein [Propionibacteriaceae bacterium]|jgi:uncharacterized protein YjdB|nr:L,D-transpeptidase family protein [Propionibacteriaceae bacterium]